MTHHDHKHSDHHGHDHRPPARRGLHKDWRAWLVVGLMLIAMAVYVLTMDESIVPGEPPGQRMPAADAPPAAP
jgi:ABC-type nickel/cobalt efflux system permease component RcnA